MKKMTALKKIIQDHYIGKCCDKHKTLGCNPFILIDETSEYPKSVHDALKAIGKNQNSSLQ